MNGKASHFVVVETSRLIVVQCIPSSPHLLLSSHIINNGRVQQLACGATATFVCTDNTNFVSWTFACECCRGTRLSPRLSTGQFTRHTTTTTTTSGLRRRRRRRRCTFLFANCGLYTGAKLSRPLQVHLHGDKIQGANLSGVAARAQQQQQQHDDRNSSSSSLTVYKV